MALTSPRIVNTIVSGYCCRVVLRGTVGDSCVMMVMHMPTRVMISANNDKRKI